MNIEQYKQKVFSINSNEAFSALSMEIFYYQYLNNPVYRQFCDLVHKKPEQVQSVLHIPFMPVSFFKTQKIITGNSTPEIVFKSSGTSSLNTSSHYVCDTNLYEQSFTNSFKYFFGDPSEYTILALLPGYIERGNSSLVYMVQHLLKASANSTDSGFYLNDYKSLYEKLVILSKQKKQKTILIGVSFALLEFSEKYSIDFPELIVMETGGMKGLRKEIVREELHERIAVSFGSPYIYSEYGMTEILSQAYSKGKGIFRCPPWMRVLVSDPEAPSVVMREGNGTLNIIDLANIHSCCFIAVSDLGRIFSDHSFEVLGRIDNSDIRGCNLLI